MGERENGGMGEWGSPLVRTNKWRLQWTSAKAKAFHVGSRQINKRENNTRRQANGQTNETRHDKTSQDILNRKERKKSQRNSQ